MNNFPRSDIKLPSSFTPIRNFQGIDEYVLNNGLKVLLFEDQSQANVTVNITYLVGSRHEGRGEAGMAHLLEHMLFRGTKTRRDVKGALQDKGAKFNATTWFDRTNYFETLTPTKENLEFALALEADRMINSLILQQDLDAEMTVVRNEFEMGENNPVHVLHDQVMSAAYRWHNYGKTTIGNRSDIERVPASTLRKFYEHYYQPDNAVLIVAGQFEQQEAMDLIEKYFAVLAKPSRILEQTYTEEPSQDGPREVVLERSGDMASVSAAYHVPAASHPDHAAIKIFMDALTDEPSGLLYRELVENSQSSELFSMVYALCEPGMALCFARPIKDEQAVSVRDRMIELIEENALDGIDEQQIERIKNRYLKRFKQSLSNSKEVALKLSEAIACGDWRLFFWYKEQVENTSLDDVKRVACYYFIRSNRTSGIFIPTKHVVRAKIDEVGDINQKLDALKEDNILSKGESFIADAKNIEQHIQRLKLNDWQSVALLAKKTRGESLRAQAIVRYGREELLKQYHEELEIMPALLWRGTTKYSYQELRDKLDSIMTSLDMGGHAGSLSVSLKTERSYQAKALELAAHVLQNPQFKEEEFFIVKQREIDDYEEIKNDPQRLGFQELERLKNPWPKDNFFYVPSFEEHITALKSLKLERVKEAYQKLFSCQNLCLGLVGDIDSGSMEQIPNLFNASSAIPYERPRRPFIENSAKELIFNTKDKEMALISSAFNFPMRDDYEDFAALKLANYMFGENMNSRLMHRIREKEGISYGAGSWVEISRHDETASVNLYAMSAPSSVSRAKKAIDEEWKRFIDDGVSAEELKNAQESIFLSFKNNLANDGYLVSTLSHDLEIARDFMWREKLFEKMNSLSQQDIRTAIQKWWSKARFSMVIAGDESKIN
ncbi:MAG: insulinase family protein [Myxococcales bacterium]|nr:insulinase family protein [Myxococcales bacterium]USN51042.1 MAG: insulinase family protein [Myxococcales bacterium]